MCHRLCTWLYYERVTLLHGERIPANGPVLFVGLHRNGAVDGFIYHVFVPRMVFMVSVQLLRSFFMRLFFGGIAVARKKDREDSGRNEEAMRQCVDLLNGNGALMMFPEGTSKLGPRHLPFKSGAAKIAVDALSRGVPLKIVPLGIHYERAWAFRSKVEVVVGEHVSTDLSDGLSEMGRLKELKRRMDRALVELGANFDSKEKQEDAEQLAYAATLGTDRSYFSALKSMEAGVPEGLQNSWDELNKGFNNRMLLRHQGVPLFPGKSRYLYAAALPVFGLTVMAGMILNALPLLAAWITARKMADDLNVVALWRLLAGLPLFVIWAVLMVVVLSLVGAWWWPLAYGLLSVISLETIYRTKKVGVSVWNSFMHASQAKPSWKFHAELDQYLRASKPTEP